MRPKIFVSSTVLDFEDLRSSLKYYLEEFGYDVQMSEYPNFNIDKDSSTFDACIKNLENCQYFILLIGYRRGSWYLDGKISITHKEFLSAKSLIEQGHPLRIIAFVRKPIWLLKNDRQGMKKHLEEKSREISTLIPEIGTTVIDDPDYIIDRSKVILGNVRGCQERIRCLLRSSSMIVVILIYHQANKADLDRVLSCLRYGIPFQCLKNSPIISERNETKISHIMVYGTSACYR